MTFAMAFKALVSVEAGLFTFRTDGGRQDQSVPLLLSTKLGEREQKRQAATKKRAVLQEESSSDRIAASLTVQDGIPVLCEQRQDLL